MEWDAKTHLQWDWENLTSFDGKESEIPEQLRSSAAAERGVVDRPIYSPGVGVCPSSDWGNGSSSRSSFSASMDSIPKAGGGRAVVINFEAVEGFPRDLAKKKELARAEDTGASPELVASFGSGSGELLIGLKLGKRTYFEDVCAGGNIRASFSSTPSLSTTTLVKKCRASHQSMQSSRCQVEGCNLDLTTAKNYHRKHRVCESHSKCTKVVVAGRERRFCQQCSRFHDLSEFDQNKRSCRRRLSNHNARRRKPALDTISFNCAKLSSAFYDDGQQMNLMLSSAPFGHVNPAASSIWESSRDFKFGQGKGSWISSTKAGGTVGPQHLPSNYLSTATCTFRHSMDGLLPFKGTTAEIFNQGPEASASASNLDGAPDLRRALSLLSTDSWGSADTGTTSLDQLVHVNHTAGAAQHAINVVHPSSDCWQAEQQPYAHETQVVPFILHSHGRLFQEFQPLKMPYETALIDSKKIH